MPGASRIETLAFRRSSSVAKEPIMFERNRPDVAELGAIAVELVLVDGNIVTGKLMIPASRTVFDVLNGPALFMEFEPFEGERRFIAKSALKAVKLLAGARPLNLAQKARDLDGFDPYSILGLKPGDAWDGVRGAYLTLAKTYHPDRFANADLPPEVETYLSGMLRRVNSAYSALEVAHQTRKTAPGREHAPVYVSGL